MPLHEFRRPLLCSFRKVWRYSNNKTKPVFPFYDKTVVASPLGTPKISKFCTQLLSNARTNACVHVGNCIITGVSPGHHAESAMPGNALKCLSASSTQHHCHRGISTLTHSHSPKICGSSLLDEAFWWFFVFRVSDFERYYLKFPSIQIHPESASHHVLRKTHPCSLVTVLFALCPINTLACPIDTSGGLSFNRGFS